MNLATQQLFNAIENGNLQGVEQALQNGAKFSQHRYGEIPLSIAAAKGNLEIMKVLITAGANVDQQDYRGKTSLHVAAEQGYLEIVEALIATNADLKKQDNHENTPLYLAAEQGHLKIVKALMAAGSSVDQQNRSGNTPLYVAAQRGNSEIVKALIAAGTNFDQQNHYGETSLYAAAQRGHSEIVKALIATSANFDQQARSGNTPLYIAAEQGHLETVKALIAAGADFNQQDNYNTPLHIAVERGHLEVVKTLIVAGADFNQQGFFGQTPLHIAAEHNLSEIAKLLIKYILIENCNATRPNILNEKVALLGYWNECIAEVKSMKTYNLGSIQIDFQNKTVSLYDFFTTKNDVVLVLCIRNAEVFTKLENLQTNSFQGFPIFADLIPNKIQDRTTEGQRKKRLYDRVSALKFPTNLPVNYGQDTIPPELMEIMNESLGNDHKSRLNLLLAFCPSSTHVEQVIVEKSSGVERAVIEIG